MQVEASFPGRFRRQVRGGESFQTLGLDIYVIAAVTARAKYPYWSGEPQVTANSAGRLSVYTSH